MLARIVFLAAALFATPALAIDFAKPFTGDDGKPICGVEIKAADECPADKIFTLRIATRNALYATFEDEKNISGDDKFKRAELAQGIVGGDVKLKAEDVALIKRLLAKLYGPLIVYQAWTALDPPK